MWEIIPIFITSCLLAFISHAGSTYDSLSKKYIKKERVLYAIMAICVIFFIGLRTRLNDTANYLQSYNRIPENASLFYKVNFLKLGSNPGFWLLQNTMHRLGFSGQDFLLAFAFLSLGPILWFVHKYSNNIFVSVFLIFTASIVTLNCGAIKQFTAMALGLIALDRMLNKKYCRFVLWLIIASTIHPYILMFALAPLLTFKPWGKKTYILLIIFVIAGIAMQILVNTILDVTTMLGEEYTEESFTGAGVNPLRVVVALAPMILSIFVARYGGYSEESKEQNLFINLTMLNGLIMFLALFGTANYFGRLAHYFLPFVTLSVPYMLSCFRKEEKLLVGIIVIFGYLFFFWYGNVYGGVGAFDDYFDRINIFEYLKQILVEG